MVTNNGSLENANTETITLEPKWSSLGLEIFIKIAVIAGLIYWFFYDDIYRVVHQWKDPSWSHGLLIPLFSLYFLNQRKDEILSVKPVPSYVGLAGLVFCILFQFANLSYIQIKYFRPLTAIAAIGFCTLFLGGWRLIKHAWLPITYLFFAVPLPEVLYKKITIPMRIFASQIAEALLNLVPELTAKSSGVVIDIIYKGQALETSLNVAEACSGMRLLMAFVALGVAMAYLHKRPVWHRLLLLSSTIPIAIFCNVVRVTTTCFIYIWKAEYAQGIYHDMLGMLMLPLAFGLYGGLAWFLSNLFVVPAQKQREEDIIIIRKKDQSQSNENKL